MIAGASFIYWKKFMVEEEPSVGLANPASVLCVEEMGGEIMIYENEAGQAGYCLLPDDRICEEWDLFNSNGEVCTPPDGDEFPILMDQWSNPKHQGC